MTPLCGVRYCHRLSYGMSGSWRSTDTGRPWCVRYWHGLHCQAALCGTSLAFTERYQVLIQASPSVVGN